ncbi:MAG: nitroreductase family protein [Clostridiales bacterium]|nr:nitroreductase family protein [Clostridiales bacterium]
MDVFKAILERRSTRSFTKEAVKKADLEKIVEAGMYAPSAINEQPWLFTVVTDKEVLAKLNEAVKGQMSAADEERIRSRSADNSYCFYYGAPALIIVSCNSIALFPAEDAACALENMFLASHALGLGSCWINQLCGSANDHVGIRSILSEIGVPDTHCVYGCAAVGHIKLETPLKERRGSVNFVD